MFRCHIIFVFLFVTFTCIKGNVDIWFGTSPFCEGKAADCDVFGFQYIDTDKSGDGKTCWTGKKVRCRVPIVKKALDTRPDTLRIATYNVYERQFLISHDGQRERLCQIPQALLRYSADLDVVIFSEVFMGECWEGLSFNKLLRLHGFNYITKTVGGSKKQTLSNEYLIKVTNGGVIIASRWPILHEAEHIYKATHLLEADQLSAKGVGYARINKLNKIYHVFGTHLQAQVGASRDEIREKQAVELHAFEQQQLRLSNDKNPRVIIGGDLNCDSIHSPAHATRVLQKLKGSMPTKIKTSAPATFMTKENNVAEPQDFDEWLDYILSSDVEGHAQPVSSSIEAVRLKSAKPFTYCSSAPMQPHYVWPSSSFCRKTRVTEHLSDHYPVFATFTY